MKFKSDKQRKAVMANLSNGNTPNPIRPSPLNNSPSIKPELKPFTESKWDEQTLKLALRRINSGKITPSKIFEVNQSLDNGDGVELTKDQQEKGLKWLRNEMETPKGVPRKNSPFGDREEAILKDKNVEVRLKDFYSPRGNYYYPYYEVSGDNTSFEYYVEGGKINILG